MPYSEDNPNCEELGDEGNTLDCGDRYNCCDCGGHNCGCRYCFSRNACESCKE